jgi:hypothetical protein
VMKSKTLWRRPHGYFLSENEFSLHLIGLSTSEILDPSMFTLFIQLKDKRNPPYGNH